MDPLFPLAALALGAAVGLALAGFRDPQADEHDLSDYHEPAPVNDAPQSLRQYEELDRQDDVIWAEFDEILPPAPPGTDAGGSPLFRAATVDMAVPTLTDDEVRRVADEWLREIAAETRMAAA